MMLGVLALTSELKMKMLKTSLSTHLLIIDTNLKSNYLQCNGDIVSK